MNIEERGQTFRDVANEILLLTKGIPFHMKAGDITYAYLMSADVFNAILSRILTVKSGDVATEDGVKWLKETGIVSEIQEGTSKATPATEAATPIEGTITTDEVK